MRIRLIASNELGLRLAFLYFPSPGLMQRNQKIKSPAKDISNAGCTMFLKAHTGYLFAED